MARIVFAMLAMAALQTATAVVPRAPTVNVKGRVIRNTGRKLADSPTCKSAFDVLTSDPGKSEQTTHLLLVCMHALTRRCADFSMLALLVPELNPSITAALKATSGAAYTLFAPDNRHAHSHARCA